LLTHIAGLLYGLRLTYRLLRRRVKQTASAVTLAYVWLTLAYVTLVVTFTQVVENGRIRFFLDPLVVVLLAAAARDGFRHVRRARLGFPSSAESP
jgi:ABC-type polysaccharide/polyol phosphate export permease